MSFVGVIIHEDKNTCHKKLGASQTYHAKKKNPVTSAGYLETKDSVVAPDSLAILYIEELTPHHQCQQQMLL
jgi:hypothetical protein